MQRVRPKAQERIVAPTIASILVATAGGGWAPTSLSRVAAYDDLLSYLAIPLSQIAVGPLAQAHGASQVSIVCGVDYIAACLFPLASRELRNIKS